ncbi:MAG: hypothetical protein KBT65_02715, partial [Sulfitobacter sp.]|nr:hypothetical protein [Sulfitobacter sp.]
GHENPPKNRQRVNRPGATIRQLTVLRRVSGYSNRSVVAKTVKNRGAPLTIAPFSQVSIGDPISPSEEAVVAPANAISTAIMYFTVMALLILWKRL